MGKKSHGRSLSNLKFLFWKIDLKSYSQVSKRSWAEFLEFTNMLSYKDVK